MTRWSGFGSSKDAKLKIRYMIFDTPRVTHRLHLHRTQEQVHWTRLVLSNLTHISF